MPEHRGIVQELTCHCGAEIIKGGRLTCPRCHQSVDMTSESDVKIDEQGCWKCQKPFEGKKCLRTLAKGNEIKCRQCDTKNSLIPKEEGMEEKIKLSCKEARLVLKIMGADKHYENMKPEEDAAVRHYFYCSECQELGFSKIVGKEVSCQEALEIWARKSSHLGLCGVNTIRERLAVEHVWGRWKDIRDEKENLLFRDPHFGACKEVPCARLRNYWQSAPLSCAYDGEREAARVIPFIIGIFWEQGWSLGRLFELQRERVLVLLLGLMKNELPLEVRMQGHYHALINMREEIEVGIAALQKIILDDRKKEK